MPLYHRSLSLRIINRLHKHIHATDTVLEKEFGLLTLTVHRCEHHSAIMYKQFRVVKNLDLYQPKMTLRSNRKINFYIKR